MRAQSAACENPGVGSLLDTASLASWGLIRAWRPAFLPRRGLLVRFVCLDQSEALTDVSLSAVVVHNKLLLTLGVPAKGRDV